MRPEGFLTNSIALVGESLGEEELRQGRPFVGTSGRFLTALLAEAKITRSDCYLTNVIKEHAPKNDTSIFISFNANGSVSTSAAYKEYEELLKEELSRFQGNVIVALGGVALWALCRKTGITKWRGSILESTLLPGRKVIPCVHPSAALRQYDYKFLIVNDLGRARQEQTHPEIFLPKRNLRIMPTFLQAMEYLDKCEKQGTFAYDIEVFTFQTSMRLSCISFALGPYDAMSIPIIYKAHEYFSVEQEALIIKRFGSLISNPKLTKITQNGNFDATFLMEVYGIVSDFDSYEDTMVAQAHIAADFPKSLAFLVSIYTREPYYKEDGKQHKNTTYEWETLYEYNAKDSAVTYEIFTKQIPWLEKMGNMQAYRNKMKTLNPIALMQKIGIRVLTDKVSVLRKEINTYIQKQIIELHKLAKEPLNHNSPKQLITYFYVKKGISPYISRKARKPTCDGKALKRLATKGHKEAQIILDIKHREVIKSRYLNVRLREGRLCTTFNPVGTSWTRLSSGKSLMGYGTNMQNLTKEYKHLLAADEGFAIYEIDLSQAENRVVAYIAPDIRMIKAFEDADAGRGPKIHLITAGAIFHKPPSEISKEAGSATLGNGEHSEYDWGKRANHAFNYNLSPQGFSHYYELPLKDSKEHYNVYHNLYPGVHKMHRWIDVELEKTGRLTNLLGYSARFMGRFDNDLKNKGYSFIPQSTVGQIVNEYGLNYIYDNQEIFHSVYPVNQVHDSVWFMIPLTESWDYHAYCISAISNSLSTPLNWKGTEFSIPVEVKMGKTIGGAADVNLNSLDLPKHLEETYNGTVL